MEKSGIPLWYEIRHDQCVLWEGVIAFKFLSNPCSKIESKLITFMKPSHAKNTLQIYSIPLEMDVEITSEGFWTCAEVSGTLIIPEDDGSIQFYYHCPRPDEGKTLLTAAMRYLRAKHPNCQALYWASITVQVDPDPFSECHDPDEISGRMKAWSEFARFIAPDRFRIVERKAHQ